MDEVRDLMRLQHYAIQTERAYCNWIARFIHFHKMRAREALFAKPESKVEAFLGHLATRASVAAGTQNQAFCLFLVFLVVTLGGGNQAGFHWFWLEQQSRDV